MRYVVRVDIGGTFTDFSVIDGRGRTTLWKEASTPREPAAAVRQGLQALAHAQGLELHDFLSQIDLFVHGSTIATNTVIQRNGPKTALLCTEGFRDVIYFRDGYKPERFNLNLAPPVDFIPRHLRLPVRERIDYKGDVLIPLDDASLVEAARTFEREQVKAVAVAFLWSVINPAHERRARALLERELPGVPVVLSSDVLPAIREWERTCATMLSAYILPGISHYMQDLEEFLRANGFQRRVLFIQLNGGCSSVDKVLRKPIYALASGPAAGPAAALYSAKRERESDLIAIDMGGTSFEVCLISNGAPTLTKRMKIHEMPVGVAAVDVHSIGAGGGSIAWIDKGGALQVGPLSAGADPGPACYAQGGTRPTVTDANLVLGYLNADFFLGGRRRIEPELSRQAISEQIGRPLGISTEEAAEGIFRIVNSNMVNALRAVSIERGIDPRSYTLVVGGGAGAIHATTLASELRIRKILIPGYAGVFCSYGMVVSDVRHDYLKTLACNSEALKLDEINGLFEELEAQARAELVEEGFTPSEISLARFADAKYPNQIHELTVAVPGGHRLTQRDIRAIKEAFHALHERMFTYSVRESPVDFFHWGVTGTGRTRSLENRELPRRPKSPAPAFKSGRQIYIGSAHRYVNAATYDGARLSHGMVIDGPAVIEQENTTVMLFGDQTLRVNAFGDYIIQL